MNQQIDSSMEDVISMLLGASLDFREKNGNGDEWAALAVRNA